MDKCNPFFGICSVAFPQRFIIIVFCILGVLTVRLQRNQTNLINTMQHAYSPMPRNMSNILDFQWRQENNQLVFITTAHPIGHFIGQIPAGILADKYSGKWTYFTGVFAGSILTLLCPTILVNRPPWFVIISIRFLLGLCHSVTFPCAASIVSQWIPYTERGMLGAYCFASYPLFYVLGEFVGFTYTSFYVSGGIGLLWCSLCIAFIFDNSEKHPRITVEEKQLLQNKTHDDTNLRFQCKKFLGDKGVWALILGQIGHHLALSILIKIVHTELMYMNFTLRRCLVIFGFIGMWVTGTLSGYLSDYGLAKKNWDLKVIRTLTTFIAFLASSVFLCIAAYLNRFSVPTTILIILSVLSKGPHYAGLRINHMDLTVNFNGILMAVLNVSGDITDTIIGSGYQMIAHDEGVRGFRKHVWYSFLVNIISSTIYFIMAIVQRAKWDIPAQQLA